MTMSGGEWMLWQAYKTKGSPVLSHMCQLEGHMVIEGGKNIFCIWLMCSVELFTSAILKKMNKKSTLEYVKITRNYVENDK